MLHRIPYAGRLPAHFEALAQPPQTPAEPPAAVLCAALADEFDTVFLTDHRTLRVAGLFPKTGGEVAYFGFWETLDDPTLSRAAFGQLVAEARARGFRRVRGPLHFSSCFHYRLRLGKVPGWGQFDREPVNPLYYPALLAEAGFVPTLLFESRRLPAQALSAGQRPQAALLRPADSSFELVPLDAATWAELEGEILDLLQQPGGPGPACPTLSRAQLRLRYGPQYAAGLCPHASGLLRHRPSGQLAALSFCRPNYLPLALPSTTAPVWAAHYPQLPRPRTLLVHTGAVHPAFRHQGLPAQLAAHALRRLPGVYDEVIFCLMRGDNPLLRLTDGLPYEVAYYALYEREV